MIMVDFIIFRKGGNNMKYKLLVNGSNQAIVKDFLSYKENYFDCLSTTDAFVDLEKHFRLFSPHAVLCFVERIYDGLLENLQQLKASAVYNSAPIVFVTKEEVAEELEANLDRSTVDLVLLRPITTDNIILRIVRHLDDEAIKRSTELTANASSEEQPSAAESPESTNKPETPENHEHSAEPPRKKHILVVDDDRNVLKMLKSALEEKYEVTSTLNGLLVEKVLAAKQVDLVVLDYEMPIMTGAEVYRKIKTNSKYSKIPICFLTGVSERSKIEEIMSLKPDSYLFKPIDLEMLMTAIGNLI